MITWAALALAVMQFIAAIMDDRRATRPQRERDDQHEDYDRDIADNAQAAAAGDAVTLAQQFEAERHAAIRRGDLDPAGADELRQP